MAIKQISAFVENQTGKLYELFRTIADAGINIRAMNIADTKEFGILRLIVDDTEKTASVLGNDTIVKLTDVIAVEMKDEAGALSQIIKVLTDIKINIEYAYAFTTPSKSGAYTVIRVDDTEAAENALKENGYVLLTQDKVESI